MRFLIILCCGSVTGGHKYGRKSRSVEKEDFFEDIEAILQV